MDIPSPKDVGARYPRKRSDQERYEEAQTALNRHIRKIINEISAFLRDPRQSRPHMAFQGASFYIGSADGWPTLNMTDPNCTNKSPKLSQKHLPRKAGVLTGGRGEADVLPI